MDGQRFDQLARALARGASRRSALKGLVGGVVGGTCAALGMGRARAQCTWSGTFETAFGGMTMTLTEAGGQVSGSYTFTEIDASAASGNISGIVRTDSLGYTIVDGYWREANEGGRVWFSMALDSCTQFTGWYTGTDLSEEWTAGWDGIRTTGDIVVNEDGGGRDGTAGEFELTFFSNPGDTRVAAYTVEGQAVTLFGPKNIEGFVEYINQTQIDAADGDPQKRVFLDFAPDGTPTRAALGSGETMTFEVVGDTSIIITYQSADGSQEVQVPFDVSEAATAAAAAHAEEDRTAHRLAYSGQPALISTLRERRAALRAQPPPPLARGEIEVRCGNGELVDAYVHGSFARPDTPADLVPLRFWPVAGAGPGLYEYTLPLLGPKPPDDNAWIGWFQVAFGLICGGTGITNFLTKGAVAAAICTKLGIATGPVGGGSCAIFMVSFTIMCAANSSVTTPKLVRWVADGYDQLEVTAIADAYDMQRRAPLGSGEIKFKARAGSEIPVGVIRIAGDCPQTTSCHWNRDCDPDSSATVQPRRRRAVQARGSAGPRAGALAAPRA